MRIANQFEKLISEKHREEVYQEFLESHSEFLPREFVQNHGVHLNLAISKLSLSNDYTTDFFYLAKSSADWHCVFVEIEKPHSRYFKDGSTKFHGDFSAALEQINKWRAWLSNKANFDGFLSAIKIIRGAGWLDNPCFVKYVLVHGRREEFKKNPTKRDLIVAQERDDFKIISYDSLSEDIRNRRPLYIASRLNDRLRITSDRFAGETLFSWVPLDYLEIGEHLKDDIYRNRFDWFHSSLEGDGGMVLEHALPKVKTFKVQQDPKGLTSHSTGPAQKSAQSS